MPDYFDARPLFVKLPVGWAGPAVLLSEYRDAEECPVRGLNTGSTVFRNGGTAIASVVGTAIVGAAQEARTYEVVETHWHDQQHKQPLEAIECFSIAPLAVSCLVAVRGRLLSRPR